MIKIKESEIISHSIERHFKLEAWGVEIQIAKWKRDDSHGDYDADMEIMNEDSVGDKLTEQQWDELHDFVNELSLFEPYVIKV